MKKFFIALVISSIGFGCNNTQKEVTSTTEKKDSIPSTTQNTDTLQILSASKETLSQYFSKDGDWIQIKNALSADQVGIYVYFQAPNDVARNLRMRMQYGDQNVYKYTIDGKSFSYNANRSKESDNRFIEGSSLSWYDSDVKNKDYKFLQALISSKNAKVTLNDGSTLTIGEDTKLAIKRSFEYFESLDGLLPKTNMVNIRR